MLCLTDHTYEAAALPEEPSIILRYNKHNTRNVPGNQPRSDELPVPYRGENGGPVLHATSDVGMGAAGVGPRASDALFLNLRDKTHTWPFGAAAELIHDSSDANATEVRVSLEKLGPNEEMNFVVIDNGCGMTHQEVLQLFTIGKDYGHSTNSERIGCNGVGFQQGVLRLGDTALVISVHGEFFRMLAGLAA